METGWMTSGHEAGDCRREVYNAVLSDKNPPIVAKEVNWLVPSAEIEESSVFYGGQKARGYSVRTGPKSAEHLVGDLAQRILCNDKAFR